MRIRNLELWLALLTILIITAIYVSVVLAAEVPSASGFLGHSLGVIGFVLMMMTEVLYSLRKRYQFARWGKMKNWLSFHIYTGLVGPFMVLLHSSWKFNGLAGILTLMTAIIVISGFIGRYFFTAIPRSVDGAELELDQLRELIRENQQKLAEWQESMPDLFQKVEDIFTSRPRYGIQQSTFHQQWRELAGSLDVEDQKMLEIHRHIWDSQKTLELQMSRLATTRKILAVWHTVHIPLGIALFTIAFIHIGATLYYATLLR